MDWDKQEWIENCYLNFLAAIEDGSYAGALDCIGDMAEVDRNYSTRMCQELNNQPLEKFINQSNACLYAI